VTELPLKGDLIISTCVLWPVAVVQTVNLVEHTNTGLCL